MSVRKIKLTKKAARIVTDAVTDAEKQFKEKFGREPGPGDPVFFDPDAAEPQFMDQKKLREDMIEAMTRAGVRPALIYAYKKTDMIVTEENRKKWSKKDIAEYNAAIDEFEALQ